MNWIDEAIGDKHSFSTLKTEVAKMIHDARGDGYTKQEAMLVLTGLMVEGGMSCVRYVLPLWEEEVYNES